MFRRITLPLLRPVLALVLVVTVIGSFQVFDTVAVTTKGGPANASRVLQYYIFQQAFEFNALGYASALSVDPVHAAHRGRARAAEAAAGRRVGPGLGAWR